MKSFAESLRLLMEERKVSVRKVVQATGIPKSTVSDWLSGRKPQFSPELIKLSQFLGVSLESLLVGKSPEELLLNEISKEKKYLQLFKGTYRITIEKEEA